MLWDPNARIWAEGGVFDASGGCQGPEEGDSSWLVGMFWALR